MSIWATAFQVGFSLLGSANESSTKGENKALTKYQNKMKNLSSAATQNSITTNEIQVVEESSMRALDIQRNTLRQRGAAEVAAAAAGVEGNSVTQTVMDIEREGHFNEFARKVNLNSELLNMDAARKDNVFQNTTSQDLRTNAGPSMFDTLSKAGAAGYKSWTNYQT